MSTTLLRSMVAYKCDDAHERETIYTVIVNTAESNVHPISYHHWPLTTGRLYQVMETLCGLASDAYNGNIKWHDGFGKFGICSEFMIYAENVLERAKETADPLPELMHFNVVYFKPDDPGVDLWVNFTKLDGFEIKDFYNEKVLVKKRPTICDLYWCQRIKKHYESTLQYAKKPHELDIEKFRKDLYEHSYMMPEKIRNAFKAPEAA